jgi:hypothetical protein
MELTTLLLVMAFCTDVAVAQQCRVCVCVCDSMAPGQEDICSGTLTYTTCSQPLTHPIMLSTKGFRVCTVLSLAAARSTGFRTRGRCRATCRNIELAVHGYRIQNGALAETIGQRPNVVLTAGSPGNVAHQLQAETVPQCQ